MRLSEIIERVRLAEILGDLSRLTPAGGEKWRGVCPIHEGAKNKMSFAIDENLGYAHCFGCSQTWNKIDLSMALYGLSKKEAAYYLAGLAGATLDELEEGEAEVARRRSAEHEGRQVAAWWRGRYVQLWRREREIKDSLRVFSGRVCELLEMPPTMHESPELALLSEECCALVGELEKVEKARELWVDPHWPDLIQRHRDLKAARCKISYATSEESDICEYLLRGRKVTPQLLYSLQREQVDISGVWWPVWRGWDLRERVWYEKSSQLINQ